MAIGTKITKPCVILPRKSASVDYQRLINNTAHMSKERKEEREVLGIGSSRLGEVVGYRDISLEEIFGDKGDSNSKFRLSVYLNEDIMNLLVNGTNLSKSQFLKIIFFLSNLYVKANFQNKYNKKTDGRYKKGWVGLKAKILQDTYTSRDWGIIRYILSEFKIIKVNDEFYVGKYCKSFKIEKKYKKGFKLVLLCETGYLVDKLVSSVNDNKKVKKICSAKIERGKKKKIDPDEYIDENSEKIKEYTLSVFSSAKFTMDIFDIKFKSEEKKEKNIFKAAKFNNKNYTYDRKAKTGRVFNSFTSMNEKLREKVKIDGENCVELDYANMQPCILSLLYNKKRQRSRDEYDRFIKILENGEFYRYIMSISESCFNWSECKRPKDEIMRQIMFSFYDIEKYPLLKAFKEKFPTLTNRIRAKKWKKYNDFAIEIQKFESDFVINCLLVELMSRNIKAITVHDSVICKISDSILVESIMSKLFYNQFGFAAKIKKS